MSRFAVKTLGVLSLLAVAAVGCSSDDSSGSRRSLDGVVQSGGTATVRGLPNATVRLYQASTAAPVLLGSATSDQDGAFSISLEGSSQGGVQRQSIRAS